MGISIEMAGLLIQATAFLGGGMYFVWTMQTGLAILTSKQISIEAQLANMALTIKELSATTIEIARQDERLNNVDSRLNEQAKRIDLHLQAQQAQQPQQQSKRRG